MSEARTDSTWKKREVPRGKRHNKTTTKTTVSLYLSKKVVEKARKHRLNISRITEQALNSILDYLETQNRIRTAEDTHNKGEWWAGPNPLQICSGS